MNPSTPHPAIADALRRSIWPSLAECALEPLPDKGLAHVHLRLRGSGLLLRLPKQSQVGLAAVEHLRYEATCFERAAVGGHTPRLHGVLAPCAALPRGALLVDEIVGRAARLPADLPAIAQTLASLHRLSVPPPELRAPLLAPERPLHALLAEIEAQAQHLGAARLQMQALAQIQAELQRFRQLVATGCHPPQRLIAFDGHPGNYVVRADGRAILVDLEKARYGPPPLDLAHATLYTSTTWDTQSHAVLEARTLRDVHEHWLEAMVEDHTGSSAWRPWIAPLRRAMWLWSITWCAKWRALSSRAPVGESGSGSHRDAGGEDWSSQLSDAGLVAHVRDRVDHYLSPAIVAYVCAEADALDEALVV